MTIDEAIKEFTDWAKDNRKEQNFWTAERNESYDETNPLSYADCDRFARDAETRAEYHEQLAEWLSELKEAKRLLKAAVEDFKEINSDILTCKYCRWYSEEIDECTYYPEDTPCEQICGWKHEVEALKLIGEDEDGKI